MDGLLKFGIRHRQLVIVFVSLLTLIAIIQLPQLRLEITAEGMMVKTDPARLFYERALDTFGSDNITIVYIEDDDLFRPDKLRLIRGAVKQINQSELVDHTDSLFNIRHLRTIEDTTYTAPYLKQIPETYEQAMQIRQAALQNPLIINNLLSADGTALAINIYFDSSKYFRGFDEQVSAELKTILQPLQSEFGQIFYIGDPYVRAGISERIRADQQLILPGAIVLLMLTLAISLRKPQAAFIPLLTAGISVTWLLGFMAFMQIPVNVMNSVIPALLIIIGSTEDIHLLAEYISGINSGKKPKQALNYMSANMGTAVLLTFVTTYVGFLSITLNDLSLLQQFGLLTSSGLLMNFIATVLIVPICLKYFGDFSTHKKHSGGDSIFQLLSIKLLGITESHRYTVIFLLLSIVVASAYFARDIRINNNVMDYFDEQSDVTTHAQILHENLSGIQNLSIVLTGTVGTFLQVPYIEELWATQEYLRDSGNFDKSFSFADFVAVVHSGIDGEWPGTIYLPVQNEVVSYYMSFLDHQIARSFVSADYSQARIIVRHNISDSETLNQAVAGIYEFTQSWLDPALDVQVTGESYLNSRAVDYMAEGQAKSLLLMLTVIFVLMSVQFMNTKAGLVALAANLFPIIVLFGVMGALGIPLNTGTTLVAAISLGICVDHSMHFMVRYNRLLKISDSRYVALQNTVKQESLPIFSTAIALAAGFLALTVSEFPPVNRFGQLSALVMLLALVSTFVITPLFLRYVRLLTVWDMLSVNIRRDVLNRCPLFIDMSAWQARKIVALSEIRHCRQDEAILLQGDKVESLYIILEGNFETWRTDIYGSSKQVDSFRPGDVFGSVAPREEQTSSVDIVAINEARLLLVDSNDVHNVSRVYPRLAVKLFKNLCAIVSDHLNNEETLGLQLHDEISGAYSAVVFTEMLNYLIEMAQRYEQPLSVICIDLVLESGKDIRLKNTQQGAMLKKISKSIHDGIRKPDLFGLWDSASFWIALPNTGRLDADLIVRRVAEKIEGNGQTPIQTKGLAFNISIAELDDGENYDSLVSRLNFNRAQQLDNKIEATALLNYEASSTSLQ